MLWILFCQCFQHLQVFSISGVDFRKTTLSIKVVIALMGDLFRTLISQLATALEDGLVVEAQQSVDILTPVVQREGVAVFGAKLGLFQRLAPSTRSTSSSLGFSVARPVAMLTMIRKKQFDHDAVMVALEGQFR